MYSSRPSLEWRFSSELSGTFREEWLMLPVLPANIVLELECLKGHQHHSLGVNLMNIIACLTAIFIKKFLTKKNWEMIIRGLQWCCAVDHREVNCGLGDNKVSYWSSHAIKLIFTRHSTDWCLLQNRGSPVVLEITQLQRRVSEKIRGQYQGLVCAWKALV